MKRMANGISKIAVCPGCGKALLPSMFHITYCEACILELRQRKIEERALI